MKQQRGERAQSSSSQSESCILCKLVLLLLYCSSSEFLWNYCGKVSFDPGRFDPSAAVRATPGSEKSNNYRKLS